MNSLGFDKKEKNTKVIVAMSGGVDSAVAAVKLKKEGYDVIGVTLRLYNQPNSSKSKSCCAGIDIDDASKVAKQYDFPHKVFDYQDKFFNGVINNFVESYANAETPVPCIKCNQTVKFSDLLEESKNLNADALITGHYAIRQGGLKDSKLYKAKDKTKDQSYFLFATLQDQLDYVRFPLGDFLKSEIRQMADDYDLIVKEVNKKQNYIVLAPYENLQKNKIFFKNINLLDKDILNREIQCSAKIRSTQNEVSGKLKIIEESGYFLFDEPISATSPGQACVFYKDDQVLGGGWIT